MKSYWENDTFLCRRRYLTPYICIFHWLSLSCRKICYTDTSRVQNYRLRQVPKISTSSLNHQRCFLAASVPLCERIQQQNLKRNKKQQCAFLVKALRIHLHMRSRNLFLNAQDVVSRPFIRCQDSLHRQIKYNYYLFPHFHWAKWTPLSVYKYETEPWGSETKAGKKKK